MKHPISITRKLLSPTHLYEKSRPVFSTAAIGITLMVASTAGLANEDDELLFGAAVVIIELTDNDIELQALVDGDLKSVRLIGPNDRSLVNVRTRGNVRRQGGLSELYFASEPTHYLEDEPEFDGTIAQFLARFPAGEYEFEGVTVDGQQKEGETMLTHVMPALPEIISPLSEDEEPPVIDPNNLVIEWEPVTTQFIGDGPVEIVEYQVILDQVEPERTTPWIDGGTRRALINLPAAVTRVTVPPEFLAPDSEYEFEILAIEESGNSTIAVGEFVTE